MYHETFESELDEVFNNVKKAEKILLQIDPHNIPDEARRNFDSLATINLHLLDAILMIQKASLKIDLLVDQRQDITEQNGAVSSGIETECEIQNKHVFYCKIRKFPLMKDAKYGTKIRAAFANELQQKVIRCVAENPFRIREMYVIFINHVNFKITNAGGEISPYYDNDNMAIKAILDATVPFIGYDDSSFYCDNLYFTIHDRDEFIELFFIEKGFLNEANFGESHLPFIQEIKK